MLAEITLGDLIITMVAFAVALALVTLVIYLFVDVFSRTDLSGWGKAGWTLLLLFFPLVGCLIYIIARPRIAPVDEAYAP